MKKNVLISSILHIAFVFCTVVAHAQNLVPNFSFEQYDTCPNSIGQIYHSTSWVQPTTGTSDYYNSCYDTTIGDNYGEVPNNYFGYQNARNGVAYSGVFAFDYSGPISSPTYREYIQTQLSSPLVLNQTYFVSVYVSLSDSSRYSTDDFGVYFSSSPISRTDFDAFGYVPQIENTSGSFLSDKTNWMKISGSFIALGNEQYITIGNFKNDANTDTVKTIFNLPANADYDGAYYYIDDICVSTDSMTCNGTVGINKITIDPTLIFYNSSAKQVVINQKGDYQIQITDLYGNIKSIQKLQDYQSIDVSAYQSGCYIVVFNNQKGSSSKKIIINP
jgi:OOP family OmpA-OmpF porin